MSYILEALKISEQSRRQLSDGVQYSLQPTIEEEVEPHRFRPYWWLAGVLLVNGLALMIWWHPTTVEVAPALPTEKASAENVRLSGIDQKMAATPAPPPTATALPTPPPHQPAPTTPARSEPLAGKRADSPARADASTPPQEARAKAANGDGQTANLLKQMPTINIAGYIHDEGSNNLVIINDKLLHEGEEIAPDLRLEKILDDGVLLNFRGHRFKR